MMHGSGCACCSVKAGVSELSRAELEAFVAQGRGICPHAWVRVEHLQRLCREAMPDDIAVRFTRQVVRILAQVRRASPPPILDLAAGFLPIADHGRASQMLRGA